MTTLLPPAAPRRVPARPALGARPSFGNRSSDRRRRARMVALSTVIRPIGDGVTGRARAALTAGR
ncbi:hypothetical protein [uncultured Jatrophihabitans sp.]|uniref:hypothetical protein n=1 Tax=uncultured Jatrophihabitans sp. TaxID=1610747 RepID=UPI0035C9DB12